MNDLECGLAIGHDLDMAVEPGVGLGESEGGHDSCNFTDVNILAMDCAEVGCDCYRRRDW